MIITAETQQDKPSKLDAFNNGAGLLINPVLKAMDNLDLAAHSVLSPISYKTLKAVIKMPEIVTKVGAAALVTAFMAGNPDTVDKHAVLADLCASDASAKHVKLCKEIIALKNLNFQEKLLAAAVAQKFEDDPVRHKAIASIIRASNDTGFNLRSALTIAMMESSLGKNIDAETSSAKGIFQYIDSTWIASVKKHGKALGINPKLTKEQIFSLRMDPDIHSQIALRDLAAEHPHLVKKPRSVDLDQVKMNAYAMGLGNAYELMMVVPRRMADLVRHDHNRHDEGHMANLAIAEFEKHVTAEAYLSHFLGKTGARNFLVALKNPKSKLATASEYKINGETVFSRAAKSNPGIFGASGERSFVEVYAKILGKVDGAFGMLEKAENAFATSFKGRVDAEIESRTSKLAPKVRTRTQPRSIQTSPSTRINIPLPVPAPRRTQHDAIGDKIKSLGMGQKAFNSARHVAQQPRRPAILGVGNAEVNPALSAAVPNITLGDIENAKTTDAFLVGFEALKRRVGKGKFIYVLVNSNGGDVNQAERIDDALAQAYHQGYDVRLVCQKAMSAAAVSIAKFPGTRLAFKGCQIMTHASYFMTSDGQEIKLSTPGISDNHRDELEDTRRAFAASSGRRSCNMSEREALALYTDNDLYMSADTAQQLGIVDAQVDLSPGGCWLPIMK